MYVVTYGELERTFDEVNRVLFFDQLDDPDLTIESAATEYSNTFVDSDGEFHLNIARNFAKREHFKYVLVLEMIRLYQMMVLDEEPEFNSLYSVFEYNAWKKFTDIEDPMGDAVFDE